MYVCMYVYASIPAESILSTEGRLSVVARSGAPKKASTQCFDKLKTVVVAVMVMIMMVMAVMVMCMCVCLSV